MQIDPFIKNKLLNEFSFLNKNENNEYLLKLALVDVIDEYETENMMKKYRDFYIHICYDIKLCGDKCKLFLLSKENTCDVIGLIDNIMKNFCPITGLVKPSNIIFTDICKNNKIIGYSSYPFMFLIHIDDIRKIRTR